MKVSVIIPTYNRAHLITESINSVLTQTYQDFEIIVIDDGSTDATKEIVQDYIRAHTNIRYIYQKNRGPAAARNSSPSSVQPPAANTMTAQANTIRTGELAWFCLGLIVTSIGCSARE